MVPQIAEDYGYIFSRCMPRLLSCVVPLRGGSWPSPDEPGRPLLSAFLDEFARRPSFAATVQPEIEL